jgi:hypothetical protein
MKKFFLFGVAMLFVGCSTVIKVGDQIERAATPPDAVNYVTTMPDGSYEAQLNDGRLAEKLTIISLRKFKNQGGYLQVQCELKNSSALRQDFNVSFEFLAADGRVVEGQRNWDTLQLEPGALHTYTATALRSEAVECRLRFLAK